MNVIYFRFCKALLLIFFFLATHANAQTSEQHPILPCDFYGQEETPGALGVNKVVTAKDPQEVVIGEFTVTDNGRYGFLTSRGDILTTPQDEGALDGDIISFYINGTKQRKQAVWKPGDAIRVDLGVPFDNDSFTLHLLGMPGYSNFNNDLNFSGVAVADMILDYLDSANSDTQQNLMDYADQNSDQQTSISELTRLLNHKAPSVYHFGSSLDLENYSQRGLIDAFDPALQSHVIKQACHWLAYKVPNAPAGKEYVPIAIATSADAASGADSDYQHWMSLVGIETNQDPFPNLSDYSSFREKYQVPDSVELQGVYLNDPGQSGLGFHTYVTAEVFKDQYFRPLASGLEGEGKYIAIMEPPDNEAPEFNISAPAKNPDFEIILKTPQIEVSFFIPGWMNPTTKNYLIKLFDQLKQSPDFINLINDSYFGQALQGAKINRCFKIDSKVDDDYTIIPFEKEIDGAVATTAAIIVNNQTGQFQIAFADPEAREVFEPFSWDEAYKVFRVKLGWKDIPVNQWLIHRKGNVLSPDWNVVSLRYERHGPIFVLRSFEYAITPENEIEKISASPKVDEVEVFSSGRGKNWTKSIICNITDPKGYKVSVDYKSKGARVYLYNRGDQWFIVLRGSRSAYCRIKIVTKGSKGTISGGGVTYMYISK